MLSMFSGCGGMDLGFLQAGYDLVWANDVGPDACATHRLNFSRLTGRDVLREGDIEFQEVPSISGLDVLTAGFPCQPYSNAGNREGMGDTRGQLYRYCLQFIERLKPTFTIFENVRGLLSIPGRKHRLIEEIAEELDALGYDIHINLVNAAHYGVPQNRLRVFMVGVRRDAALIFRFPTRINGLDLSVGTLLDVPEDAPNQKDVLRLNPQAYEIGNLVPEGGSWKSIPDEQLPDRLKRIRAEMRRYRWPNFYRRFHRDEIAGTITAAFKPENAGVWHPLHQRAFSVREIARIQSFPDDFVFIARSVKGMYEMIGNAVPPRLARAFALSIRSSISGDTSETPLRDYFAVRSAGRPIKPGDSEMIFDPRRRVEVDQPSLWQPRIGA
jgi:DNA (cytosine-5)-methyltransferase 1